MLDLVFVLGFGLFLALSLAILPELGVFAFELIGAFIYGLIEVVGGVVGIFTTSKEERAEKEKAAREAEEEWYDYNISHNSHRL